MKAQTSQVFVYALTAVAVGLVLLLGYKFITKTLNQGCDVQLVKFRESLDNELNGITHGSYRTIDIGEACTYGTLCFIDSDTARNGNPINTGHTVIDQSVQNKIPTTVFLIDNDKVEPLLENSRIVINDNAKVRCIAAKSGRFAFGIEGVGQNVSIQQ